MDLNGQKVLILGALGTAGAAIAKKFAQEGAAIMLSARRASEGEKFADELRGLGQEVGFVAADVTKRDQVISAVEATVARFGQIDVLVNCFSRDHLRRFMDDTEEAWDEIIQVNFKGLMYACHASLQHMVPQSYGRIISLTSDSGKIGATMETAQSGMKAAVIAFSKSLAREMARYNITVNSVCMGPTRESSEAPTGMSPEGWASFMRLIPFRRPAKPEEVAAVVAFLATRDASFVTGQALSASGGLVMC